MSALDDAIAEHMAHGAGACADPLTDALAAQCTQRSQGAPSASAGPDAAASLLPPPPAAPWGRVALVALLFVAATCTLGGCGGGGEDLDCTATAATAATSAASAATSAAHPATDWCAPPADGRRTTQPPACQQHPERCS